MTLRLGSALTTTEGKQFVRLFVEMGYLAPECANGGIVEFDIWCEVALKQFQLTFGLDADGIYGRKSEAKASQVLRHHRSQHGTIGGPNYLQKWRDGADKLRDKTSDWHYTYGPLMVALEEMDAGAKEEGGNNRGEWVAKYHRVKPSILDGKWAWCAAFVSWCYNEAAKRANVPMLFEYTGSAQRAYKNMAKSQHGGRQYGKDYWYGRPGNIVVWWRGPVRTWKGHIEMWLLRYGDVLVTIGGNVGSYPARVRLFSYTLQEMPKLIGFAGV